MGPCASGGSYNEIALIKLATNALCLPICRFEPERMRENASQ